MATRQEVERRLRELIDRLDEAGTGVHSSLAGTLPDSKLVEIDIPDLQTSFWTTMSGGKMNGLHRGVPERADIRVQVDSDHLVELLDGKRSLFSSFMAGSVRIEASLSDLLRLRKLA